MARRASVRERAASRGRVGYEAVVASFVAMFNPFLAAVVPVVSLVVIAVGAAWDLVVLAGLAVDVVRIRRGQRPVRVGVDYGAGDDVWFETTTGSQPYRSFDERRLLARGDPAAAFRAVGRGLALRLGLVIGVVVVIVATGVAICRSYRHYPGFSARIACSTVGHATARWMAVNPGRGCPTVGDLKTAGTLDVGFSPQDPWGGGYETRCHDDEIVCTSPGPDRKRGTRDDIVVPLHPPPNRLSSAR